MLYKEVCMRDNLFDEDFEINNENLTELKLRCFNQDYEAMYLLAKYYLKNKDSIEDIKRWVCLMLTRDGLRYQLQ